MSLERVKWLFLVGIFLFLGVLEYARRLFEPFVGTWQQRLLVNALIVLCAFVFFGGMLTFIQRIEERLERRNRELLALHRAALDIHGELSLGRVLQRVVDRACPLVGARYGAIAVIDRDTGDIEQFVTAGLSDHEREAIGPAPEGRGLLGVTLREGQRLRVPDIGSDPRSVGFPANHPPMRSLLAVPIVCRTTCRGNLYVSEKIGASEFTAEDEESLVRFATTAALAIDTAQLHQRARELAIAEERVRIGREMHDGLAQVLAYVNTKAQAVSGFLERGRIEEAREQLDQLAVAAREVSTDVREGILALRTELGPDRSLDDAVREFIGRWESQSGIGVELTVDGEIGLSPPGQLQLLRIVQESLSNVRKHSGATEARVVLQRLQGRVLVRIEDDGRGFDPEKLHRANGPRFGLAIMRERAVAIGGNLDIEATPGGGTRITVEAPVSFAQMALT